MRERKTNKVLFVILLVLLFFSLIPLFLTFLTSVIPDGDLFHITQGKTFLDFEKGLMFQKAKMKVTGTKDYKQSDISNGNGKSLYFNPRSSERDIELVVFMLGKDINLINYIEFDIDINPGAKLRIGVKDMNDNTQYSEKAVSFEKEGWHKFRFNIDTSEFDKVDPKNTSQIIMKFEFPEDVPNSFYIDEVFAKYHFPTFINFKTVWEENDFARYIFNSSLVSITVVLGNLIFCSMVAYAFARKQFRGKEVLFSIILSTMMIPPQVIVIPIFILMKNIGWIDTYQALIVPSLVTPFGIFFMRQYIEQLPLELDKAAFVDGATDWQIFTKIILPLSKPAMAVLGINSFIGVWNDLFMPLILVSKHEMWTVQVGLANFSQLNQVQWPSMMAASTIAGLPIIIVFLIFQKQIISGVVDGAVKY